MSTYIIGDAEVSSYSPDFLPDISIVPIRTLKEEEKRNIGDTSNPGRGAPLPPLPR
jgi:hypothetical protein